MISFSRRCCVEIYSVYFTIQQRICSNTYLSIPTSPFSYFLLIFFRKTMNNVFLNFFHRFIDMTKIFNLRIAKCFENSPWKFWIVLFLPFIDVLTHNDPCISESCIETKIELNFYFQSSLRCLKRFYEGLQGRKEVWK